ncbi:efflux RND transporter periplasmic adaptor subunit [Sporosalibacterium faouarense]|uniref:efflux RND transporter periplasmic adaptor subunit n=1 Tax=Sporosalibacterium faouarense TaxID=516123 RepID=UPI003C74A87F
MVKRLIKFLILITAVLTLTVGCSSESNNDGAKEVEKEDYVPVEIESVKTDTIFREVTISGQVHPNKDIMILPKTPGKVADIRVELGDKVSKGQVLFTLDREDIQKQINQAEAALNAAKKSYAINEEQIENAKTNLERTQTLYEQGAVSKSQYEQAKLAASDKPLEAAQAQIDQAQISYNQAKEALDNTVITSPMSGTVSSMNIDEGEFASNAQPAMNIIDANKLYVQINVTEDIVSNIEEGQEVRISFDALSRDTVGTIDQIYPTADARTQLYPVKIYIDNEDNKVMPGMFAKVSLKTDVRENVLVIKGDALVEKDNKTFVYVVEDNAAVEKEVETGLDEGMYVEIKAGLGKAEKVVIKGQNYVGNGSEVKVVRGDK